MMEPIKIHPFDAYELMTAEPRPEVEEIGHDRLIRIGGVLYEQTTKIPAITTAIK